MNDWLKRCVFNLDLNTESVSEPEHNQEDFSRVYEPNVKKRIVRFGYTRLCKLLQNGNMHIIVM